MKPSFVTWQLRHLHAELDTMDKKRGDAFSPTNTGTATVGRSGERDHAARTALLDRLLRSLPKRFGFRDARAFLRAFVRANQLSDGTTRRRRLMATEVEELERRVMQQERPAEIARAIGCAEQTVLNRATQLRKRLANQHEQFASGI
ncbi:MAG TPA: hypothetical protein VHE61_11395 [Opitutaceae bacterium]|nr:hypothetical protein [Opitutaceae bacterium]